MLFLCLFTCLSILVIGIGMFYEILMYAPWPLTKRFICNFMNIYMVSKSVGKLYEITKCFMNLFDVS